MSIIEQAARRLEELRRSGIDVQGRASPGASIPAGGGGDAAALRMPRPTLESARPNGEAARDRMAATLSEVAIAARPAESRSKRVHIDLARLASMGYLTPAEPRARIADEFRIIKRPLLVGVHNAPHGGSERSNLIMVTSSLPGEGKTFVSVNLAISIAMELDKTVLLVDADVSRPSVLPRLGLPQSAGLLDLLTDSSIGMSDVLLGSNIDKLTILPAGAERARATELLASDSMSRLLDELSSRYADRIIVFDAPPLLPSTESRVLATRMGQVVMVVEADNTPHRAVSQALSTIEACPVVFPLLNKISRSEVGAYYGYYGPQGS